MALVVEPLLIRVAGLPLDVLGSLQYTETWRVVSELEHLEDWLNSHRSPLCDNLHSLIAHRSDRGVRQALLEFKRAVHNNRPPRGATVLDVASALEERTGLLEQVRRWEAAIRRYRALADAADSVAEDEAENVLEHLRKIWSTPAFQTGILMAQPMLYHRLVEYLRNPITRDRRVERSALAYLYRMATKTSPFSSFTSTGFGTFGSGEAGFRSEHSLSVRSQFALNITVAERLAMALRVHPAVQVESMVRLHDTLYSHDGQLHFLRSGMPDIQAVRVLGIEESFVSVKANALINRIVALLAGSVPEGRSLPVLISRLHNEFQLVLSREQIEDFVQKLMNCGLVQVSLDYEGNSTRALGELAEAARRISGLGATWADQAQQVESCVEEMAGQPPGDQAASLKNVKAQLRQLFAEVAPNAVAIDEQGLVHHDTYLEDQFVVNSTAAGAFLDDLRELTGLMPLFDDSSKLKKLASSFFESRYGADRNREEDLLPFYRAFYEQCCGPFLRDRGANARLDEELAPEVAQQLSHRRDFLSAVLREALLPGVSHVQISRDLARRFGALAQPFRPANIPVSVGCFGHVEQATGGEEAGSLRFILNQVMAGYGHYAARFTSDTGILWQREAAQRLRQSLSSLPDDGEVVELIGTFGFNGQVHPRLTARRLVYPGESTSLHGDDAIAWSDLAVRLDGSGQALTLVQKSTGVRLLPVNLSPAAPHLMPAFFSFVCSFGPSFRPTLSLVDHFEKRLDPEQRETVRHYARVEYGKVVLSRETWCIPPSHALVETNAESDLAYFRRLRKWAAGLGLPRRVFVVPERLWEYLQSSKPANNVRRLYKPFYVDFDDFLSGQLFRRFTENVKATLMVSEMLPLPEHLPLVRNDGRYVSEVLIELTCDGKAAKL